MPDAPSPPLFLLGALRSGTTLLRLMLDHHREISNFGEFEYAVRWTTPRGMPPECYRQLLCEDRVFRAHRFQIPDSPDPWQWVQNFLDQARRRADKPIVGACVHSQFQYLFDLWPDARFLHIVRDPRDVARSCIGMGWVGNVWYGATYWLEPVERWQALCRRLPQNQRIVVRYEDLVREPRQELTRICHWLGFPFDANMLEYPRSTNYAAPDPSLAEQWRSRLTDNQAHWVESVCFEPMQEYGYRPTSGEPTPPSVLRRCLLTAQHRTWRIGHNIRRYGLPLYVAWQIAQRTGSGPFRRRVLRTIDQVDEARLK